MDDHSQQALTLSSRQRLLACAMRLFAEQGFRRTTVGEIEQAAGFTPRGGTLYKHFSNKEALIAAAVERHVDRVGALRRVTDLLPLGDDGADLRLLMGSLLAELSDEREITAVLEKEGALFPELRDRFYRGLVEPGFRDAAALIDRMADVDGGWDAEALGVITVGALVNHLRNEWTFGAAPLDVSRERLIQTLTRLLIHVRG